jgi:hypothetical protein
MELARRMFGQLAIVDHTHTTWKVWSLTFRMKANTLTIKPLSCYDNLLHCILFIKYFILNEKNYKIWKFISYWNFVQMKWFGVTLTFFSIMYIITFISFWECKIIWTIFFLIIMLNNISMTILLKKKCSIILLFSLLIFANIIILFVLNYF